MTNTIASGTAVTTTLGFPRQDGIVSAIDGETVTIQKHGDPLHYVGGGSFTARLSECIYDVEVNAALETISTLLTAAAQLKAARKAAGLRIETRAEYDLKHEARRLQNQIAAL